MLSPEQISLVKNYWNKAAAGFTGKRNNLIINIILDLGLKTNEVSNLNIDDVDFKNKNILVSSIDNTKTRTINFSDSLASSIKEYLYYREDNLPTLFVQKRNPETKLTNRSIERIFKETSDKVDIKLTPKEARKTFARTESLAGTKTSTLRKMLGISDNCNTGIIRTRSCEEIGNYISIKKSADNSRNRIKKLIRICNTINDKRYCIKIKDKWYIRKDLDADSLYRIYRNIPDKYITLKEASKILNCNESFIKSEVKRHPIDMIIRGKTKLINKDQLNLLRK
jgi:hypothetical protein